MAVPRPRRRYIFTSIRISLHLEGFAQPRLESNVGSHNFPLIDVTKYPVACAENIAEIFSAFTQGIKLRNSKRIY